MLNPYEPPNEKLQVAPIEMATPSVRRCLALAIPINLFCSIIGVLIHGALGNLLLHSLVLTQVWIILACSMTSILCSLLFGKDSLLAHSTQLVCAISGGITIVCCGTLLLNWWQTGVWDEQMTFYRRAYRLHFWSWLLYLAIIGIVPSLLAIARFRGSHWLCITTLLLTTPFVVIFVFAGQFAQLLR